MYLRAKQLFLKTLDLVVCRSVLHKPKVTANHLQYLGPITAKCFSYTGGPRYMRSFYLRFRVYAIEN